MSYDKHVRRGAALLDRYGPPDWVARISVRDLDMSSFHDCVLGQLYGDVRRAPFIMIKGWGFRAGFNTLLPLQVCNRHLVRAWRREIERRMGDIGKPLRETTFEPMPETEPMREPSPPITAPERETVPA